jgi:hypothetical protein
MTRTMTALEYDACLEYDAWLYTIYLRPGELFTDEGFAEFRSGVGALIMESLVDAGLFTRDGDTFTRTHKPKPSERELDEALIARVKASRGDV